MIKNDYILISKQIEKNLIKTQDEARDFAIDWQNWQSNESLSYAELLDWKDFFEELAIKFDLKEEFEENGII